MPLYRTYSGYCEAKLNAPGGWYSQPIGRATGQVNDNLFSSPLPFPPSALCQHKARHIMHPCLELRPSQNNFSSLHPCHLGTPSWPPGHHQQRPGRLVMVESYYPT